MRIRSFIIAYALVLAILLFADRRPGSTQQDRYSHVVDLTAGDLIDGQAVAPRAMATESRTHIIAPGALIPGTWSAGQIPPERLVAPLVVMDLNATIEGSSRISLDDIAAWEAQHGMIPQGAVVAIRFAHAADNPKANGSSSNDLSAADLSTTPFPIARDAAQFLMEARYTIGFAVDAPVNLTSDRTLARQLAPRQLRSGRSRALHHAACDWLAHHRRSGKEYDQETGRSQRPRPRHGSLGHGSLGHGALVIFSAPRFTPKSSIGLIRPEESSCLTRAIRSESFPTAARLPRTKSSNASLTSSKLPRGCVPPSADFLTINLILLIVKAAGRCANWPITSPTAT